MSRLERELRASLDAEKKKNTMYEQKLRHTVEAFKKLKAEKDSLDKVVAQLGSSSSEDGELENVKKEFIALTAQLKEKEQCYMASNKLLASENAALKQKLGSPLGNDKLAFEESQKKMLYSYNKETRKLLEKPLGPGDSFVKQVHNLLEEKELALRVATETNATLRNEITEVSNENSRLRNNISNSPAAASSLCVDNQLDAILRECDDKQRSIQCLETQIAELNEAVSNLTQKKSTVEEKENNGTLEIKLFDKEDPVKLYHFFLDSLTEEEAEEFEKQVRNLENSTAQRVVFVYRNNVLLFTADYDDITNWLDGIFVAKVEKSVSKETKLFEPEKVPQVHQKELSKTASDNNLDLEKQLDIISSLKQELLSCQKKNDDERLIFEKNLDIVQEKVMKLEFELKSKNDESIKQLAKLYTFEQEIKDLRVRAQEEVEKRDKELEAQRKILVDYRAQRISQEKIRRNNEVPENEEPLVNVVTALGESQNLYYESLLSKKNTEISDLTRKLLALELKLEDVNKQYLEKQITSLEKERIFEDEIRTLKNDSKLQTGNELEYLRNIFKQYIQCVDKLSVQSKSILKAMGSVLGVSSAEMKKIDKK